MVPMPTDIHDQRVGGLATPSTVLLQALHDNPVQVGRQCNQLRRHLRRRRDGRRLFEACGWLGRLLLTNDLAHRVDAGPHQFLGVKRGRTGKQFV